MAGYTSAPSPTPPRSPALPAAMTLPLAPSSPYMLISSARTGPTELSPLLAPQDSSGRSGSLASSARRSAAVGPNEAIVSALDVDGQTDDATPGLIGVPDPETLPPIRTSRTKPRFWALLPVIALIDVVIESYVGISVIAIRRSSLPDPSSHVAQSGFAKAWTTVKPTRTDQTVPLTVAVLGVCLMRSATIAVVGIGNKTDQLGLIVAGICTLSALVLVAAFNLLFQSGELHRHRAGDDTTPGHSSVIPSILQPSLALLTSAGLVFTVLEYILYVLVVGIRVPPGGGAAINRMQQTRLWKRGVREAQPQGDEEDWIMEVEGEEDRDGDENDDDGDPEQLPRSSSPSSGHYRGNINPRTASLEALRSLSSPPMSSGIRDHSRTPSTLSPVGSYGATSQNVYEADSQSSSHKLSSRHSRPGATSRSSSHSRTTRQGEQIALRAPSPTGPSRAQDGFDHRIDLERNQHGDAAAEEDLDDDDDPNEIMDIPLPSSTSRDLSRFRLALSIADEPERRRSRTLSAMSRSPSSAGRRAPLPGDSDEDGDRALEQARNDKRTSGIRPSSTMEDASGSRGLAVAESPTPRRRQDPMYTASGHDAPSTDLSSAGRRKKQKGKATPHDTSLPLDDDDASVPIARDRRSGKNSRSTATRPARAEPAAMLASLSSSPLGTRGPPLRPAGSTTSGGPKRSVTASAVPTGSSTSGTSSSMAAAVRAGGRRLRSALSLHNNTTSSGLDTAGHLGDGSSPLSRGDSSTPGRKLFGGNRRRSGGEQAGSSSQHFVD
ncbi:unnamed protein product [Parajaminaea phylloscopi]